MSIEILGCLKRKRDICIKTIIPSQNTAFMCEITLFARVKISCLRAKARLVFHWCTLIKVLKTFHGNTARHFRQTCSLRQDRS